jgi:glucosylceramidase
VAFKNTDGSKVLVVYNETTAARPFQAWWGTQRFTYTLPSLSGATFVWSGAQTGSYYLPSKKQIQTSSYSRSYGLETEMTSDSLGGYDVGYSDTGDWAMYKNVAFGTGITTVKVRTASGGSGGTLEFRLDSATGTLLGTATLPATGGWQTWQTVSAPVVGATGTHNLYLVFKGGKGIANVNWFVFQ